MFGGDQRPSRNSQWSAPGGQQGEGQQPPAQPPPSNSGMISGAPSFYDPSAVGPQPQPSLGDHQWLQSNTQQYASGMDTGAYTIPYRQQQSQPSTVLHESFPRPQQRTTALPQQLPQNQQQAAPHLLNQYNFVAPQYQPPQQTQYSLDQSAAPGYRSQALGGSYLYGQVPANPAGLRQEATGVENFPYAQQFQFFNSPLSDLANNATSSSSSSELLAHPPPHGPSVSPSISDRSSRLNTSGLTPPPPSTSSSSTPNPAVSAAEPNTAQNKPGKSRKKQRGVKRPRAGDDSTTDTDEDDTLGGVTNFSIHLTQPPRASDFRFPSRL